MRLPRLQRLSLLAVLLVLAPAAAPLAPGPLQPAAAAPDAPRSAVGFDAVRALLLRHAPEGVHVERFLDALPAPFGPSEGARSLADAEARPPASRGPSVAVSGDVPLTDDWYVGDLTLTGATVRFLNPSITIWVQGALTIEDSTLRTEGLRPGARGRVVASDALDVRRSTFAGVGLFVENGTAAALVADSTFRDQQGTGIVLGRPGAEVRHSTFLNLSTGIEVRDAHGFPERGPEVHNSTFEATRTAIRVEDESAGTYHHNVARGNGIAVSCLSPGATDQQGNEHRARFSENDLFTNYAEAISGIRGITIPTPIGDITIPSSACDHDQPYLGPSGAARDTTFLSNDDTLTNVRTTPNANSAPTLPAPLTEITSVQTWTGARALDGPVVVNSPGHLTLDGAALTGPWPVGAKANGELTTRSDARFDPLTWVVLRNAADLVEDTDVGGPDNALPVTMHRCNCTLRDSRITFRGIGVMTMSGLVTDDTAWRPTVDDNLVQGPGVGLVNAVTRPQVTDNTFRAAAGVVDVLGTINFQRNVVEDAVLGFGAVLDTITSGQNRYEGGTLGVLAALATTTFSEDIVASYQIGLLPVLPTTFTLSSSNVTFNAVGVLPILGVATITTTNFVDNYLLALATLPIDTGNLSIPTGITCTTCWGPADEARWGNITYVAGLNPNDVPKPSWDGLQRIARSGETKDLSGTLDAPAVARSGGTLRVRETTLDLAGRYPVGAKGGGISGGTTGTLLVENATVRHGAFIALNSTSSVITHSRLEDFPDAAVTMVWNGGTFACNAVRDVGAGFRFNVQQGAGVVLRRTLVEGTTGLATGLIGSVKALQAGRVEDSGVSDEPGGTLFGRAALGDAQLHRSNLLANGSPGAVDHAEELDGFVLTAFNATDNWWGHPEGPGRGGSWFDAGDMAPLLAPHAAQPFAPALCMAWDVVTAQPKDDAPAAFRDRAIDPSGLGLQDRAWDFGDGEPITHAPQEQVEHRFPDGGTYTVTLTDTSHSSANASLTRTVSVAHTPPLPAFAAEVVDEVTAVRFTDQSTHGNPNDAPPTGWAYAWLLGDGSTSALREPERRYADGGTYTVRLTTTDNDGLTAATNRSIQVPHVAPVASFSFAGAAETDDFAFADTSTHPNAPTDGIATRAWSCTDGFTSSAANPTHRFADGGAFSCTLTVTDNDGMSSSATRAVSVAHVGPVAAFTNTAVDELSAMAFTDATTHPNAPTDAPPAGYAYAWTFGDGATSTARDPARDYADGGNYSVSLTATDDDGVASTASRNVTVAHVAPIPQASFAPANPEPGAVVQFTDASTHPNAPVDHVAAWAWDFGDGATSALPSPEHVFADLGIYNVTLTLTDDDGLAATLRLKVPVGNIAPVAAFTWSPTSPTDLETVQFTDKSTDADGAIVAWAWDFGDGATSTAPSPAHLFEDDGLFTVRLTVTDDLGAEATLSQVLEVRNVAPTPAFAYGPQAPHAGEAVQFRDDSTDPDGSIVTWAWDFGDGATSAIAAPAHTYASGGDYTVTLRVWDDDGALATVSRQVHVCETGLDLDDLKFELCLRVPFPW